MIYVPSSSRVINWFNESSKCVKFSTYAKFDKGFNDLYIDNLPSKCQQIFHQNRSPVPVDSTKTSNVDFKFIIYPFVDEETIKVIVLPSNKDPSFSLKLQDDDLSGRSYIKELADTNTSSAAKMFGNVKQSRNKLHGVFVIHINAITVLFTPQATVQLTLLFHQWKKTRDQRVYFFFI